MERLHREQHHVFVVVRRRRRRHIARFTSQHLLSLCFGAYIIGARSSVPATSEELPSPILQKSLTKSPSIFNLLNIMEHDFDLASGIYKSRPVRIRYRNDQFLLGGFQYKPAFYSDPVVRPLLTDDHNYLWSQGPSSSYSSSSSKKRVNTRSWGQEFQLAEKSFFSSAQNKFYGNDLTNLAEKNFYQPLSSSEVAAYQDSAKNFFVGYLSQTDRHRFSSDPPCPREDLNEADSWVSKRIQEKGTGGSSFNVSGRLLPYNTTFLDSDNPVLNNVSLSQSAQFFQNDEDLISENAYFPSQDNISLAEGQNSDDSSSRDAAISLSPTLTLEYFEFGRYFANSQVKEDITSAVLELNGNNETPDYFSDFGFASTSSKFNSSLNRSSSSPSHSDGSTIGLNECGNSLEFMASGLSSQENPSDYAKLFPKLNEAISESNFGATDVSQSEENNCSLDKSVKFVRGRRGRRSKDEILAIKFNLPATAAAISEMSLSELQNLSRALTDEQRAVMKKIRRRGKNKVAARMCRQRKILAPTSTFPFKRNLRS